jgi:hypothetical protein
MNEVIPHAALPIAHSVSGALSAAELQSQFALIQQVAREAMQPGVDYGYIPGTEPKSEEERKFKKPALFKPGAEKLLVLFRLGPDYDIVDKERDGDHLTITSKCTLTHFPTGQRVGSALGSCSTLESKYAYRHGSRACPECGAGSIIKGKEEYGGGYVCFAKKGGCGAKFADGDDRIEGQQIGKVANEDKADQYNTVLKMSNKRALIAATLNATAASAIFSQDILDEEDVQSSTRVGQPKREVKQPRARAEKAHAAPLDVAGTVNEAQVRMIRRKCEPHGPEREEAICTQFGVEKLEDIPAAKVNEALAAAEAE